MVQVLELKIRALYRYLGGLAYYTQPYCACDDDTECIPQINHVLVDPRACLKPILWNLLQGMICQATLTGHERV